MFSKISLSIAAALALSIATAGVARANPIPTSTDEARELAGRTNTDTHVDAIDQTNGIVTSSDEARAQAGRLVPATSGAWVAPTIAKNEDEGRAAAFEGYQAPIENESLAVSPAASGMTGGSN